MSKDEKSTFAEWFSKELEKSGVKLSEVSQKTGLTAGYLSMLRTGQRANPRSKAVQQIARALKVPLEDACEAADIRTSPNPENELEIVVRIARGAHESELEVSIRALDDPQSLKKRTIGPGESQTVGVPGVPGFLVLKVDAESEKLSLNIPLNGSQ